MRIDSLKEFLEVQKQYAELLIALYSRRNLEPLSYREALDICGGEEKGEAKLQAFLNSRRLGIETESGIVLDPTLRQAYERIMHTNMTLNDDVISHIRPEVERLCEEWDACSNAQEKRRTAEELYRTLDRIPEGLETSISDLSRFMEEQYKAAISFSLKRAKLLSLAKQANQIQRLMDESHRLLSDDSHKLRTVILKDPDIDSSLLSTVLIRAKAQLLTSSSALIEVTRRLQEYISKVERASRIAKRAHLIGQKIRNDALSNETTFPEAVKEVFTSGIKGETYVMVDKVDVMSIAEEGTYNHFLAEISAGTISGREVQKVSPPINFEEIENSAPTEPVFYRPDYRALLLSFIGQRKDLFSFILNYDFPQEVPTGQRVEIFLYFCSSPEFAQSLDFPPGQYGSYRYRSERSGKNLLLEYQIVKAR